VTVAHYLGLTPKWVDGTAVGGCSFIIHVRHAAGAIASGLCETVLITHGESGRSGVGRTRNVVSPASLAGQFEQPYGPMGPPTLFTISGLRYMKTYGLAHEQLAMASVVQRKWAAKNPRATFKDPITVEDVLNSRMIAYPFRLLQWCLVTDGGGALILVAAERARDFLQKPSTCSAPTKVSRRRWSGERGAPNLISLSRATLHGRLLQRAHELDDCRVKDRSYVELAIIAADGPIRMARQRVAGLSVNSGFAAFRDKAMPPGMVRIEATVGNSNRLADPLADPFGGRTGAPAKSIGWDIREQRTVPR
jgi:acetyl-CoA acetyltransferase